MTGKRSVLVLGSTSHPDTLRRAFTQPGRLERVVEVSPNYPADIIEALRIHAADAEKLAGRALFQQVDWQQAVASVPVHPMPGDWVHILHSVLRRKARCEAAGDQVTPVTTADFREEAERFQKASSRLATPTGNYV